MTGPGMDPGREPEPRPDPGRDLHGRPTAGELLDAIVGYLRDDLSPRLEGGDRHMMRIAVRALEVVGREMSLGAGQAAAHADRLEALGFPDDAALAESIRAGEVADSTALRAVLTADTVDRLLVANPQWLPPRLPAAAEPPPSDPPAP